MRDLIKPAIVLVIVSVVVVVLLAFTDHLTRPVIAQRALDDQNAAKLAVLPAAQTFEETALPADLASGSETLATVIQAWKGLDASGAVVGYVVSSSSKGYGGPVKFITGLESSGKIVAMKAISHKETPGLGDKVLLPQGKVMKQVWGLTPTAPLKTVKGAPQANEVDAVAGSTITSRAVVRAASGAWELAARWAAEGVKP